jgi:hypothetical protein
MSKKKEKHPSASDKTVAYLKTEWQIGQWSLDNIAQHLFAEFDTVPGTVRDAYRRSAMHAFNGARAKLIDIHRELVIPKGYYKGKTVVWAFATGSKEDEPTIQQLVDRKKGRATGCTTSYQKAVKLVEERGWLDHERSLTN